MQDISIVTSRLPTVDRPPGSRHVYLTFEGLRESRTLADRRTRVRVTLPASEVAEFVERLAAVAQS